MVRVLCHGRLLLHVHLETLLRGGSLLADWPILLRGSGLHGQKVLISGRACLFGLRAGGKRFDWLQLVSPLYFSFRTNEFLSVSESKFNFDTQRLVEKWRRQVGVSVEIELRATSACV